ncbi:hypothetical protein ABB37_00902 [Leptomonas pyrrhocoris]|uniref:Uncharacterized protein n=1 Tax=Leptomonas pyrrhocoris TaxID=157538 RepID=A0A0M9GBG3_LEPPY|nr:hypothetical protein ABB37_00902 [Leptomonas pyrrhocoris]KPA86853.1 hypothetical protein ABB37_00902 [Leptomonas pyrrhocoris]|eukprot:XP_015665292.1 hypothetical protein ABB37_00902 [Leptomonas pyrrhocoris]
MFLRRPLQRGSAGQVILPFSWLGCASARSFSSTTVLQKKTIKKRSTKRPKHERKQPQPQRLTSPTVVAADEVNGSTKAATLQTAHPVCQADSSASAAASTSTTTAARGGIREKERDLLRYFGRARHHYDAVPLHKATAALQCASNAQANRVPFATLFPSPTVSPPRASRTSLMNAEGGANASLYATTSDDAPYTSPPSVDASAFAAPNLFVGYDHKLRQFPDWTRARALNTRFGSAVDGNKLFGAREVPLLDISEDTSTVWATLGTAWEEVLLRCSASCSAALSIPSHQSVCFVVCFAQTRQSFAIASSMHFMAQDAVQRCAASPAAASPIFAVVPIYVGVHAPLASTHRGERRGTKQAQRTLHSCVEYASGGLYTCSAVTQCLARMEPRTCAVPSTEPGQDARTYRLDAHVFLVSDTWLNARSVADLYAGHLRASDAGAAAMHMADATSAHEEREGAEGIHAGVVPIFDMLNVKKDTSAAGTGAATEPAMPFIPDASRQHVHVFPGVVFDQLSRKEQSALGAFLWCTMERVCGKGVGSA